MDVRSEAGAVSTVSRREMLRQGAALGAAVAVATPVVQGFGRIPAFAQATPPPSNGNGNGNDEPTVEYPSHFQIVIDCGFVEGATRQGDAEVTTLVGVQFNESKMTEGNPGWAKIGEGNYCPFDSSWRNPTSDELAQIVSCTTVLKEVVDDTTGKYVLSTEEPCKVVEGVPFDGTCGTPGVPGAQDNCGPPAELQPDGTYAFTKCD